jgi:glycosyltransferase involved in cell wall biosynthesis
MPGFVDNPYAYMRRSSLFVLSSAWEGLPTVLIEAMACGCQVISTNCPSGPEEILRGGHYGKLVPVGDAEALAKAILADFDEPARPVPVEGWRPFEFSVAVSSYLKAIFGWDHA